MLVKWRAAQSKRPTRSSVHAEDPLRCPVPKGSVNPNIRRRQDSIRRLVAYAINGIARDSRTFVRLSNRIRTSRTPASDAQWPAAMFASPASPAFRAGSAFDVGMFLKVGHYFRAACLRPTPEAQLHRSAGARRLRCGTGPFMKKAHHMFSLSRQEPGSRRCSRALPAPTRSFVRKASAAPCGRRRHRGSRAQGSTRSRGPACRRGSR